MVALVLCPFLRRRAVAVLLAATALASIGRGTNVEIDATAPVSAPAALPFPISDRSPDGHVISANSRHLELDGHPWFPVAGEFHYARYPAAEWEREVLKMKAGGIDIVSTYVFWIHHEETEGHFDWSGRRNLREFVAVCARHGLKVWLRIGPWAHGEARNGGFPDWLVQSGLPLRQNDPKYLAHVSRFFGEIAHQVQHQFWRDGGPIVAVQIENEYHPASGGIEHMRELHRRALAAGFAPAFFSATGWDQAVVPPTDFLPVFGGYTEQFWSSSLAPLPPNQNFFFTPIRAEDNVMGDLTPKIASYNSQYDGYPFLTAEMGGGMSIAYHRRPLMTADDSTAAAVVKLGSGANCLGFYMYHGGTNPDGLTSLQETQSVWNGYNDMEAKSYDFQAPLGEFGQVNPTYRTLKTVNLFLNDFGAMLAPMTPRFPNQKPLNRDDTTTPRVAARTYGDAGFVFINNYERNYPLGDKTDFQVSLRLPHATVTIPRHPTTIPNGAYPILPVNFEIDGVRLQYATAQLLCRLADPKTLVFFAWPGLAPEFAFETSPAAQIVATNATVARDGTITYVEHVRAGRSSEIRVTPHPGAKSTRIILLSYDDALHLFKASAAGRERLFLSGANLAFDGDRILLNSRSAELRVAIYPGVKQLSAPFHRGPDSGIFAEYVASLPTDRTAPAVTSEAVRPAATPPPVRLSPAPRAVAMEPTDDDFERAAIWKLHIEPDRSLPTERQFLQISYQGDVARIYAGGHFDNDNFYKGTPWELGLWRYAPAELKQGLKLEILPLRRDAPIFLEPEKRPDFGEASSVARLVSVRVIPEYDVAATVEK